MLQKSNDNTLKMYTLKPLVKEQIQYDQLNFYVIKQPILVKRFHN